jgi:ADP-heptose:LPS heptosyltransferase
VRNNGAVAAEPAALRQQTGSDVIHLAGLDLRDDLDGLAALVDGCDLVIMISNATVHISGALGRPTWLLLHQVPYWPWQLEGETSPWHPSLRLFRQSRAGAWREPLELLREALRQRLNITEVDNSSGPVAKLLG